jgi:glycosyltransferase involved in cell wall biosynthesis
MSPQVSVIIPLYNKGSHVARAIQSVLTQTVQDFEMIIMDGNSTDEGPDVVKRYTDPRIHFHIQNGSGVSAARNQGVEKSQSDFIAFLDADDEWMPHHLETLFRLKGRFPGAGMYTTAYQTYLMSGKHVPSWCTTIPIADFEGILPNYFESAALGENPVWTSTVGMMKELFFKTGGFQEGVSLGEDIDLWAKIALKYPIAYCSDISAVYHIEASNRACVTFYPLEEQAFVKNAKKAITEGIVPQKMIPHLKKYIARKEIDTAVINIFAGDYQLARKILARTDSRFFWLEKCIWSVITRIPKPIFDRIRRTKNVIAFKLGRILR